MANEDMPYEDIRLQAEHVAGAYKDLCSSAKNSDFTNDDFPIGKFAELFQQLKQLDSWLQTPGRGSNGHDVLRAAAGPYNEVSLCVEQARALADILQLSTDGNEPNAESITVTAGVLFNRMREAASTLTRALEDRSHWFVLGFAIGCSSGLRLWLSAGRLAIRCGRGDLVLCRHPALDKHTADENRRV